MSKFYITSSLIYTNAPPHIGFALEVIQADVIARYHRFLGEDTFFLTGTDEHGGKIAKAAKEKGKTPEEFTEELSKKAKDLKEVLNLSNDDFIRTTDQKRHWSGVKKVWLKLKENGDIYKKGYKGFYCLGCEAFVTEKDLVNGKCPFHQKAPEIVEEENYFFRLSKYSKQIERAIRENEIKIVPETRKNEILSFIKQGVEDISCSRARENLKWGIPVPDDDTQVIYIWMEALVNYISALGYGRDGDKFKKFWPADVHCVGKDIFRFHILLWPAMILSLGLALPRSIFVHGFITVGGQKMSKSLGNVIDPFELVEKYGTDATRYYLLSEITPFEDGDFTTEKFEQRYNADLANGIGNLVARVSNMLEKDNIEVDITVGSDEGLKDKIDKKMQQYRFDEALKILWQVLRKSDEKLSNKKPWELEDAGEKRKVLEPIAQDVLNVAESLQPFLPETAEKIIKQFSEKQVKKGKPLFPRIK